MLLPSSIVNARVALNHRTAVAEDVLENKLRLTQADNWSQFTGCTNRTECVGSKSQAMCFVIRGSLQILYRSLHTMKTGFGALSLTVFVCSYGPWRRYNTQVHFLLRVLTWFHDNAALRLQYLIMFSLYKLHDILVCRVWITSWLYGGFEWPPFRAISGQEHVLWGFRKSGRRKIGNT